MHSRKTSLAVTVWKADAEFVLNTYPNEYRNLMELLKDQLYCDDFGDCRGVGRCGTCAVAILSETVPLDDPGRNEETTLSRCGFQPPKIRLSCQILIDQSLDGLQVKLT